MRPLPPRALLLALALVAIASGALARSTAPPTGRTLAPGEQSCAGGFCHSGPGPTGVQLQLLDGAAAFTTYTPGQVYNLTVVIAAPTVAGRQRWGFEMTGLTTAGGMRAGSLESPDPFTTVQATIAKDYISHTTLNGFDGTFDGAPGPTTWNIRWTAPAPGPGAVDVTFYACGNASDGSDTTSGDAIACTTFPVAVGAGPTDTDGDTLPDFAEIGTCTDSTDADTDDDGLGDGEELTVTGTDPCRCDTDADTLPDGLEAGRDAALPDTAVAAGCFVADSDAGATVTDPTIDDSDGDSPDGVECLDGGEDANGNGRVDAGESDPNVPGDCPATGGLTVRIDARVTSLSGGAAATCGLRTNPSLASWMLTSCAAPRTTGCDPAAALPSTRTVTLTPGQPGPDLVLSGEGVAGFEAGVLTYYEMDGCSAVLRVSRSGNDLQLDAQ